MRFILEIVYLDRFYPGHDEVLRPVIKNFSSSGAGFGKRLIRLYYEHKEEREAVHRLIAQLKLPGLKMARMTAEARDKQVQRFFKKQL
jgi:hypothetical protein